MFQIGEKLTTENYRLLRPTHLLHARQKLNTFSFPAQKFKQNHTAQISGKIELNTEWIFKWQMANVGCDESKNTAQWALPMTLHLPIFNI